VLTVVPTPLGNLRDITLRALAALAAADVIACEDTRRTRALLSAHGIPAPELVACDERREPHVAERLVARALAGEQVALVSDSGMPLIADPGRLLVARALGAGCPLVVLPGAGAVDTALVASGLAAEGYAFLGWVPRAAGERARFLGTALAASLPSVMFESPRRLAATLADLARLGPEHPVAVARELTKLHEEVVRGSAQEVAERGVLERGEVCLVVAAAPRAERGAPAQEALEAVRELVAQGLSARRASELVARLTGASRRALYDAAAAAPKRQSPRPTLP
jgi:16S rRNA (cytidine1402-2'-O)-methyltransferase